jgi:hypothetical protein
VVAITDIIIFGIFLWISRIGKKKEKNVVVPAVFDRWLMLVVGCAVLLPSIVFVVTRGSKNSINPGNF